MRIKNILKTCTILAAISLPVTGCTVLDKDVTPPRYNIVQGEKKIPLLNPGGVGFHLPKAGKMPDVIAPVGNNYAAYDYIPNPALQAHANHPRQTPGGNGAPTPPPAPQAAPPAGAPMPPQAGHMPPPPSAGYTGGNEIIDEATFKILNDDPRAVSVIKNLNTPPMAAQPPQPQHAMAPRDISPNNIETAYNQPQTTLHKFPDAKEGAVIQKQAVAAPPIDPISIEPITENSAAAQFSAPSVIAYPQSKPYMKPVQIPTHPSAQQYNNDKQDGATAKYTPSQPVGEPINLQVAEANYPGLGDIPERPANIDQQRKYMQRELDEMQRGKTISDIKTKKQLDTFESDIDGEPIIPPQIERQLPSNDQPQMPWHNQDTPPQTDEIQQAIAAAEQMPEPPVQPATSAPNIAAPSIELDVPPIRKTPAEQNDELRSVAANTAPPSDNYYEPQPAAAPAISLVPPAPDVASDAGVASYGQPFAASSTGAIRLAPPERFRSYHSVPDSRYKYRRQQKRKYVARQY